MLEKSDHVALTLPTVSVAGLEDTSNSNTNLPSSRKSLRRVSFVTQVVKSF